MGAVHSDFTKGEKPFFGSSFQTCEILCVFLYYLILIDKHAIWLLAIANPPPTKNFGSLLFKMLK